MTAEPFTLTPIGDDAVLVADRRRSPALYARNLPALAAAAGAPELVHRFDNRGYVTIGPVMLWDGYVWMAEDEWAEVLEQLRAGVRQ